ncbi:uncharacterized protein METZ01_LOCUS186740, partial [marine metagenome]
VAPSNRKFKVVPIAASVLLRFLSISFVRAAITGTVYPFAGIHYFR